MSDVFGSQLAKGHTSRAVVQPPGGHTSNIFGSSTPTPAKHQATTSTETQAGSAEVPRDQSTETQVKVANVSTEMHGEQGASVVCGIDELKLQVVGLVSKLKRDTPEARAALSELLKKLEGSDAIEKSVTINAETALDHLKAALKARGTHGIISLGRRFRSMDDDNDRKISFEEFKKAIKEMELNDKIAESDVHRLFRFFDADCSGYLTFNELLVGLRGELNPRRKEMVTLAFKVFDKSGDGQISMDDLKGRYDASRHPDVVLGTRSTDSVLEEFLSTFESQGGGVAGDGIVTFEEFCKYYGSVSASVDDDDYFELMIRNVWHISGGEGWSQNTTCKRVLVVHMDGSQTVQEVKDDFDIDPKDTATMRKKLEEQGITDIKSIALYGMPNESSAPGSAPGSATATPVKASPGPAPTPTSRPTSSRAAHRDNNMRSSIVFG